MAISKIKYYRDLADDIKTIAMNYFIALRCLEKEERVFNDSDGEENDYEKHVRRVRKAFQSLDGLERTFINNEFFYEDYPEWWNKTFSRTSFYRIRRKSMIDFLEAFNNEC